MGNYKKLIVAVVGLIAIILGPEVLGLAADTETTVQSIMGLLTAFGVFQMTNVPPTEARKPPSATAGSPWPVTLGAVALALLMLGGCVSTLGVDKDRLDTANKQLADKVLFVESLANFATRLTNQRVLSSRQAAQVAGHLQSALNRLNQTQAAIASTGDPSQTLDTLTRVDQVLATVLDLLVLFAPENASVIEREFGDYALWAT